MNSYIFVVCCCFPLLVIAGDDDQPQLLKDVNELSISSIVEKLVDSQVDQRMQPFRNIIVNLFNSTEDLYKLLQSALPNINSTCSADIRSLLKHKIDFNLIKFLDSQGRLPPGLLNGAWRMMGSYEECIEVAILTERNTTIHGQYCSVELQIKEVPLNIPFGICVPSSCNMSDFLIHRTESINEGSIKSFFEELLKIVSSIFSFISINRIDCVPLEKPTMDSSSKIAVSIISLFGFLVILGTSLDLYQQHSPSRMRELDEHSSINTFKEELLPKESEELPKPFNYILKSFSAIRHIPKILSSTPAPNSLTCIHGIRVLSISWIILGHSIVYCLLSLDNIAYFLPYIKIAAINLILRATLGVDSFLVISGMLLTYLFMKHISEGKKNHWALFYLHRFLRITPTYMILLSVYGTFFIISNVGPMWPTDLNYNENCKTYWWRNLLYINNFSRQKECMSWSWYLAADMQYFVISPLFLIPLSRKPAIAFSVMGILAVASWITTGALAYSNDLIPILGNLQELGLSNIKDYAEKQILYYDTIFMKPYTRIVPYLIGAMTGVLLHQALHVKPIKLTKWQVLLGWVASQGLLLIPIFCIYNVHLTRVTSMFFIMFHRTSWALGVSWIIYACATGYGGYINDFLSFHLFIPLSRLSYCVYLIHPMVINSFFLSIVKPMSASFPVIFILTFGFMVASYILAVAASLAVETPIMTLEKLLFFKESLTIKNV